MNLFILFKSFFPFLYMIILFGAEHEPFCCHCHGGGKNSRGSKKGQLCPEEMKNDAKDDPHTE